jgi:hypothetical protein
MHYVGPTPSGMVGPIFHPMGRISLPIWNRVDLKPTIYMTRGGHINRGPKYRTERTGTETGCTETEISNHYFDHRQLKTKI